MGPGKDRAPAGSSSLAGTTVNRISSIIGSTLTIGNGDHMTATARHISIWRLAALAALALPLVVAGCGGSSSSTSSSSSTPAGDHDSDNNGGPSDGDGNL